MSTEAQLRASRIHFLFNELHQELLKEADYDEDEVGANDDIRAIASAVDAAHHDYTDLTLQEIT